MNNRKIFHSADILLPRFDKAEDMKYYPVIACDQHTGEPAYWQETERLTSGHVSTLSMILPEVYLSEAESRLPRIHASMRQYEDTVLKEYRNSVVFVERTQADGRIRRGVVCALDLEAYDYAEGSKPFVRATEGTVLSRIPPRVAIRRGASLELPHVMLLIDDPEKTVIEPEFAATGRRVVYDTDLMQGGGHIRGTLADGEGAAAFLNRLNALAVTDARFTVAVGDGNHSLASAKAWYEEVKTKLGAQAAAAHPARYALVEIVNLYSEALDFEPIHRLVLGVGKDTLLAAADAYCAAHGGAVTSLAAVADGESFRLPLPGGKTLSLAVLTDFLDGYAATHKGSEIDYIHGDDTVAMLAKDGAVGIYCEKPQKEQLFPAVAADGRLPRKTFSMGNAWDKRYYFEARKITY